MRELTADHFAKESNPTFPLMYSGEVWYTGWDIPGYWAVDADGRGFADFGAHGVCLKPYEINQIISEIEGNGDPAYALKLRKLIARKPPLPGWMSAALSAGWTPPSSFDRSEYE